MKVITLRGSELIKGPQLQWKALVQVVDGGPVGSVWDGGWSLVQDIAAVAKVSDENGWSSGGVAASMSGGGKDEISHGSGIQVGLADMEDLVGGSCSP